MAGSRLNPLVMVSLIGLIGSSSFAAEGDRRNQVLLTAKATTSTPQECKTPKPGDYLVVAQGSKRGIPLGRLLKENWSADGEVKGTRFEREGQVYTQTSYKGKWQRLSSCGVLVERGTTGERSEVILYGNGSPRVGLDTSHGGVVNETWISQSVLNCREKDLNGTLVNVQQGFDLKSGIWHPNAMIKRETWINGGVAGIAIIANGGKSQVSAYQGRLIMDPDASCIGRLRLQDAKGITYVYVAILRSDRKGYAYLQTQGSKLNVGLSSR